MKKFILIPFLIYGVVGCSSKTFNCGDNETVDNVIGFLTEGISETFEKYKRLQPEIFTGVEEFSSIQWSIDEIRTMDGSENIGSYVCLANLVSSANGKNVKVPITYTISNGEELQIQVSTTLIEEEQGQLVSVLFE